jgi:hypothetical protein
MFFADSASHNRNRKSDFGRLSAVIHSEQSG